MARARRRAGAPRGARPARGRRGGATALLADDLLTLIVGLGDRDARALPARRLGPRRRRSAAPRRRTRCSAVGDLALILGAVLLGLERAAAGVAPPWSLSALAARPARRPPTPGRSAVYLLFLLAAMAKAGAMPMHSWIPTMSTTTHASVMAFLPGLARQGARHLPARARERRPGSCRSAVLRTVVMAIGAVTILCGVLMALVQHDLRRLLSFHAVSQVGYMLLGIGTGTLVGRDGRRLPHGEPRALQVVPVPRRGDGGARDRDAWSSTGSAGSAGRMPVTFGCMLVAALSISGIPPLNGFASKWLVYQGCVAAGEPVLLVAALLRLGAHARVLREGPPLGLLGRAPGPPRRRRGSGAASASRWRCSSSPCSASASASFAAWPLERFVGPAVGLERGGASALAGVARDVGAAARRRRRAGRSTCRTRSTPRSR